jgi:hypothetical protein
LNWSPKVALDEGLQFTIDDFASRLEKQKINDEQD